MNFRVPKTQKVSVQLPSGKTFVTVASIDSLSVVVGKNPLTGRPKIGEDCKTLRFTKTGEEELIPNAAIVVDKEMFYIESVKAGTVVAKHYI
jgi:hypothetical protein